MSEQFSRLLLSLMLLPLAAHVLLAQSGASANGMASDDSLRISQAGWSGDNFVISFSDSINYHVVLEESDSSLVIAFDRPVNATEEIYRKDDGTIATLSRGEGKGVTRLTVRGPHRINYSTLWRPYSHRLIVYTFDSWDRLDFAANKFHTGLLALEQGLEEQAISDLSAARASNNGTIARQAESVLGVLYARRGNDSVAKSYLATPFDRDDYMARSEIAARAGDSAAAAADLAEFQKGDSTSDGLATVQQGAASETDSAGTAETDRPAGASEFFRSWKGLLLLGIAALLILVVATLFARRPAGESVQEIQPDHDHDHDHHHHAPTMKGVAPVEVVEEEPARVQTPPTPPIILPETAVADENVDLSDEPDAEEQAEVIEAYSADVEEETEEKREKKKKKKGKKKKKEKRDQDGEDEREAVDEEITEEKGITSDEGMPRDAFQRAYSSPADVTDDASSGNADRAEVDAVDDRHAATPETPDPSYSTRRSAQADELRKRIESVEALPDTPRRHRDSSEESDSTISTARKLNVSRDYVALRDRLAKLRDESRED